MELIKFVKILQKNKKKLIAWWLAVAVLGTAVVYLIPQKDIAVLSIDIARESTDQRETLYEYDQFYRLEADDRFANTLVQWSKDPNVQRQIEKRVDDKMEQENIELAVNSLRAEKRSANLVQIRFAVDGSVDASIFAKAIFDVYVQKTKTLNNGQTQDWFKIIGSGPTVQKSKVSLVLTVAIMLILGLMMATVVVLLGNYFKEEKEKNEDRN